VTIHKQTFVENTFYLKGLHKLFRRVHF